MIPLFETVLTKRGFVVALITTAAVLGAGFGLLPGLLGDADDASSPATTADVDSLPDDGTTAATGDVETATRDGETAPDGKTGGTSRAATTRPQSETRETTESTPDEVTAPSTTDESPDSTVTPTTSDDSAAADAEMTVNASVGAELATPSAVAG